jgi:hypothetical protein
MIANTLNEFQVICLWVIGISLTTFLITAIGVGILGIAQRKG